jgi:L-lysine exporter family protein LysE/ArgO
MLFLTALKGFALMFSVIVAIGPQNAFLLRQSIRREHAWLTAGIFLFGDITMVLLGGFGIGHLLERWPLAKFLLTLVGAVYVFWFGVSVFRQLLKPKTLSADAAIASKNVAHKALAVTFLNPHAIFDTVILVGTISLQFPGSGKNLFMAGAITASACWFLGVAWIGQRLAPFLSRPEVWRVIDGIIVVIMLLMATMLGVDAWRQGQNIL